MTYEIENGVPVPRRRKSKWTHIHDMVPGDSFVIPESRLDSLRNELRKYPKEIRRQWFTRATTSGRRVWRRA